MDEGGCRLLQRVKILEPTNPNKSTAIFGGQSSGILNWNDVAYPQLYEVYTNLLNSFWKADEVNMQDDIKQFPKLPPHEQKAYLYQIGMLATLDGPQTRLMLILALYASDQSITAILAVIAQQEAEHNRSYSYELSSVTPLKTQNETFELGRKDPIVLKRNQRIEDVYNKFVEEPTLENIAKVLVNSSVLEGLYFYSSFAFFYNLVRQQKMVKTSTMISYINRDEMQHGRFIGDLFRILLTENPELNTQAMTEYVYDTFREAVDNEIEWSEYILSDIDGIDLVELNGYIKYRANKMLRMLGLGDLYEGYKDNPMPWIKAYVDNFNGTKSDFFEQKSRQYTKTSEKNGFDQL
jgi:ribonucleoside-diphosphate reductase beta chain